MEDKVVGLQIHEADNVAVIFGAVGDGGTVWVNNPSGKEKRYTVKGGVGYGHKIAIQPIARGEKVIKYGEVIGAATQAIPVGGHVHVDNLESLRARGDLEQAGGSGR